MSSRDDSRIRRNSIIGLVFFVVAIPLSVWLVTLF